MWLPKMLLAIFKRAPNLSSISIYPGALLPLLDNEELCRYFKKMITKLLFYHKERDTLISFDKLDRVWKVFSSVEQLQCDLVGKENIIELLCHLPNLSSLHASSSACFDGDAKAWLNKYLPAIDQDYSMAIYSRTLLLWINRKSVHVTSSEDPHPIDIQRSNDHGYIPTL